MAAHRNGETTRKFLAEKLGAMSVELAIAPIRTAIGTPPSNADRAEIDRSRRFALKLRLNISVVVQRATATTPAPPSVRLAQAKRTRRNTAGSLEYQLSVRE